MTSKIVWALALLSLAAAVPAALAAGGSKAPRVRAIHYVLDVNPVTQDYLSDQLSKAASQHDAAAVIVLDTPGGLSDSMRKIVQKELASPIPVIVYVSPSGARAASAGVWICEAADVCAMAPQTNIGSSTPIDSSGANIGSDLRRKIINDAAASLRTLMQNHGRDAAWGDLAVRKASNLTEQQALKMHVVDAVAPSLPALLTQLDGYKTVPKGDVLHLGGATIDSVGPGFLTRLLNTLIDPNLLTLLFLAGIAGLAFEVFHPGIVLPGALGAVALLTALFGFSVLPISWAGLALLLFGVVLIGLESHVSTHGTVAIAGITSLAVGCLLLFHNAPAPYHTSAPLVIGIAVALGGFYLFAVSRISQVRRRPVATGAASMVGEHGFARSEGTVFVHGEIWRARPADGDPLHDGEPIEVAGVDEEGLVLLVRPLLSTA